MLGALSARWLVALALLLSLTLGAVGDAAPGEGSSESDLASSPAFREDVERARADQRRRAEERRERRATPEAKAARERSRTRYRDQSAEQALETARQEHRTVVEAPAYRGLRLHPGERLVRFLGDTTAQIDREGSRGAGVVESTLPMQAVAPDGRTKIIDLGLEDRGGWLEPAVPLVGLRVPKRAAQPVLLEGSGVGFAPRVTTDAPAQVVADKTFYAEVEADTDYLVQPLPTGVESFFQLRSPASPESFAIDVDLPQGAHLRLSQRQPRMVEVARGAEVLGRFVPPAAWDADHEPVDMSWELAGSTLRLSVPHRGRDVAYPILVDPTYTEQQRYWHRSDLGTGPIKDKAGWVYGTTDTNGGFSGATPDGQDDGLWLWSAPHANAHQWARWVFTVPREGWIFRYESYTSHTTADYGTTLYLGVHGGSGSPGWNPINRYDSNGTYIGPGDYWAWNGNWAYGYLTACVGNNPCFPYNSYGQPAGYKGNSAVYWLYKDFGAGWHSAWMGGAQVSWQDDTPPSFYSVSHTAPAGWTDVASFSATAGSVDWGIGVAQTELWRLSPNAARLSASPSDADANNWANGPICRETRRPVHCRSDDQRSFSVATAGESNGVNTYGVRVRDGVWNWSGFSQWQLKLDRSAPAVPTPGGTLYQATRETDGVADGTTYTVVVNASDPHSGVKTVAYKLKSASDGQVVASETKTNPGCHATNGCSQQWSPSFSVDASNLDGEYVVEATVTDQLDHVRTVAELYRATIDHAAPTITNVSHSPTGVLARWHNGSQPINSTVTASDGAAGVRSFALTYPDGSTETRDKACGEWDRRCAPTGSESFGYATDSTRFPAEGNAQVRAVVRDGVTDIGGRASQPAAWTVKIDRSAPEVQLSGGLTTTNPTGRDLHVEATDGDAQNPRSGVKSIEVLIDRDGDGTPEREAFQEQTCPTDSCPMELDYALPADYPEGRHQGKVVVTDHAGNLSEKPLDFYVVNLLPASRSRLGLEDFFDYDSLEAGGESRVHVNAETGNAVWHSVPIVNPGRGLSTFVNLTYNSQDRGGLLGSNLGRVPLVDTGGADLSQDLPGLSYGEAGAGFSISVSGPTRINEPLGGAELAEKKEVLNDQTAFLDYLRNDLDLTVPDDTPLGDSITLTDSDGTVHTFQRGEGNTWVHPPGVTMHLRRYNPAPATRVTIVPDKWAMTRPDGVTHFFDNLGYLTSTKDRNGNTLRYDYEHVNVLDGTDCPAGTPIGDLVTEAGTDLYCVRRLYRVVDPAGVDAGASPPATSTLSIEYRAGGLLTTGQLPFDSPLPFPGLIGGRAGRIDKITDHAGRTYEFDYDADGFLTRFTEVANAAAPNEPRVTKLVYEPKDPGSPATTLDDGLGQDRQLTDVVEVRDGADYAATKLAYQERSESPPVPGALRKPRRADELVTRRGFERRFGYAENADATRDMSVVAAIDQDASGTATKTATTLHQVDDRGRPVSIIDALGQQTKLEWSPDHRVTKLIEAAGTADQAVTDMTYTDNGLLDTRTTFPSPTETRTTDLDYRDSAGIHRSAAVDDSAGSFVSDLSRINNPKSDTHWRFTYLDDRGNPTQRIDAKDEDTVTTYDARGQIVTEEDEVGNLTRYGSYHSTGQPRVVIDPKQGVSGNRRWIYRYDAVGNVTSVTDPRGDHGQDVDASASAEPTDSDFTTTLSYDAFDRLTTEVVPKDTAGAEQNVYVTRSRRYDRNGNLSETQDGNKKTTSIESNKMDEVDKVDAPGFEGREVSRFSYDGLDRLIRRSDEFTPAPAVTDTPDARTDYLVDAIGQRVAEVRSGASPSSSGAPPSLATSYAYDARGNVVRVLDPRRNGRRSAQEAADAVRNGEARVQYAYNDVDELVEEKQVPPNETGVEAVVTRHRYDANGNRTLTQHPRRFDDHPDPTDTEEDRFVTQVAYDHRDQVTSITDPLGKTRRLSRREDGKVFADTSSRGGAQNRYFTTHFDYDELGEVRERSVPYGPGQYGLSDAALGAWVVRYDRDEVGNPTKITDPRGNQIHNTFFDTGELKSTDRPSYWRLDWSGEDGQDDADRHASPDAGERFGASAELDPEVVDGGPRLVERTGRSANAERSEDDPELPTSMGYGNFGSVDAEELGDLLPAAGTTRFAYDDEMRLTDVVVSTPEGTSPRAIEYDDAGRVTRKAWHLRSDGDSSRHYINHRFAYDGRGNLASFVDGEGQETTYEYDAFDRRFRETAPGAGSAEGQVIEPETTRFGYDDNGNLTSRRTPRGDAYTFQYGYDALDRLIREANPEGETWRYCLDVAGNRVTERPPLGSSSSSPLCDRDGRGQYDTDFEFDAADRMTKKTDALGQQTTHEYDDDGNLERVVAPGAKGGPGSAETPRVTETVHDARGLQWKHTVGVGEGTRTTLRTFDANGNLRRVVNPKGVAADPGDEASDEALTKNATLRKYDRNDLLTAIHLPWGERDDLDRKRYVQRFDRDSRGRVRSMFAAHEVGSSAAEQTSYTHFENDWIRSASDPQVNEPASPAPRVDKHLVDYDYDRRGNQTLWRTRNSDGPKGRTVTRAFWPNGLLRSRTGRKVTDAGEDEASTRTYRYGYNANRSLVRMVDERASAGPDDDREATFGRDGAERETFVNETWSDGKDTRLAYDANGNVTQRQTDGRWSNGAYVDSDEGRNDAKTTNFDYDRLDRETEMRVKQGDDALRTTVKAYHPSGDVASKTSPNGVLEERYFDGLGDPSQTRRKRASDAGGDWSLKDQRYAYDANGNRTRDERGTHEFNARDQLVKWTRGGRNGAHGTTVSYELNGSGAIAKRTDSALPAGKRAVTYTFDGTRLRKAEDAESVSSYSYDDFGSVIRVRSVLKVAGVPPPEEPLPALPGACEALSTEEGETRYCYDEFERLVAAKGPGLREPAVNEYDGLDRKDRRIVKTATGDAPRDLGYVGSTRMLSRERDAAGETHYYDYDSRGERQGQANAPTTTSDPVSADYRSYGHDANGTVEELQASDGSVGDGERYRYDPYGELERRDPASIAPSPDPKLDPAEAELSADARENPFRFQGFYYDSGVKTYDMHARHYRPDTGRFLTQDRFESARGDFNLQADPLTQNRYVFGGANPINNIEFDGHDPHARHDSCVRAGGSKCGNVAAQQTRDQARGGRHGGRPTTPITGLGGRSTLGRSRVQSTPPRRVSVGTRGGCGAFGGICSAGSALGQAGSSAGRAVRSAVAAGAEWVVGQQCRSGNHYACGVGGRSPEYEPFGADDLLQSSLWVVPQLRLAAWALRGGRALTGLLRSRSAAKPAIGFAEGLGETALTAERLQHGTKNLTAAGILPKWSSENSPRVIRQALTPILERPRATFDHSLGGTRVRGFLGDIEGNRVAVFVYKEGPYQGQLASSYRPSANQLKMWGVGP